MISTSFIITSLIVVLVPGTGVIYTLTTSLSGSRRYAVLAAIGCTLGIVPHLVAAIFGLSAILNASAQVLKVIKILGVLYLLYLGVGLLSTKNVIDIKEGQRENPLKIIGKAVLLNLLNPKLTLFFFSFLPQFVNPEGIAVRTQMTILSLFFMGLTLIVFCLYGLLANLFKQFLIRSPKVTQRIQQSFGLILIGFAGKLALEE